MEKATKPTKPAKSVKRAAAIQMSSTDSVIDNLKLAKQWIGEAAKAGAELVVLPENVAFMGRSDLAKLEISESYSEVSNSETKSETPIQTFLGNCAKEYNLWLLGGSIPIKTEKSDRVNASSILWDNQGRKIARYDKIHLFDVAVADNEQYLESRSIAPGKEIICVDSPVGQLGLSICYDVRFPELYRALLQQGAEILCVPSAFTAITGAAHWESLLRARAIENLCYVIAPDQTGKHPNGRETYGHSMIIDPWGKILASIEQEPGFIIADIDLAYLRDIRERFPALTHRTIV